MKPILDAAAPIYFGTDSYAVLRNYIEQQGFSQILVLVDSNTEQHCLPYFKAQMEFENEPLAISVPVGEEFKVMGTCMAVIDELSHRQLDRKAVIINLGGGVITDMGGFIASIYKRGIQYVNVPTTLLAMVDASVGGKTGVDLGALKNQIGVINNGGMVIVDPTYLETLPERELLSGFAEVVKHGLVSNAAYWEAICKADPTSTKALTNLIYDSVAFKNKIVTTDPKELGVRKILNYGHTLGHAIETYCLESEEKPTLLHGEAIIIGLILETYIATQLFDFPKSVLTQLVQRVAPHFAKVAFNEQEIKAIIELMIYDKKNVSGKINFVLLSNIGQYKLDQQVSNQLINQAFDYYFNEL